MKNTAAWILGFLTLATASSSFAGLSRTIIEGYIESFNSKTVSVRNANAKNATLVPRELFVQKIETGEYVKFELTQEQFKSVEKLNEKINEKIK